MVAAAQRDGELVTRLAAKRPRLRNAQVMGIGGLAAADQARLVGDKSQMVLIADAPRLGECEGAFVDTVDRISCGRCDSVRGRSVLPGGIPIHSRLSGMRSGGILIVVLLERRHFGMERRLDARGVGCGQAVLRRHDALRPKRRRIPGVHRFQVG